MILILAGTLDGRQLAVDLVQEGYEVLLSAVSEYGGELARDSRLTVRVGPLDQPGLVALLKEAAIQAVVDASHPYAANASQNAMAACEAVGIPYIRYERPAVPLPAYEKLYEVYDAAEAAKMAASLGNTVFLTTGSRALAVFKSEPLLADKRVIARVLPEQSVLQECLELGFSPRDIVAMQGPFSHELNVAMFTEFQTEVVVTKNSGQVGGSDTKISAAMALDLPLVVISRPKIQYGTAGYSKPEIIALVKEALLCNI